MYSDADSEEDFVGDRNALAATLRDGTYFCLSLEVGPQDQPQDEDATHQDLGWMSCDRPSRTCNAWTHRVREDITYKENIETLLCHSLSCTRNHRVTNPEKPTNPIPPSPMRCRLGVVPTLAWRFHWKRRYNMGRSRDGSGLIVRCALQET